MCSEGLSGDYRDLTLLNLLLKMLGEAPLWQVREMEWVSLGEVYQPTETLSPPMRMAARTFTYSVSQSQFSISTPKHLMRGLYLASTMSK